MKGITIKISVKDGERVAKWCDETEKGILGKQDFVLFTDMENNNRCILCHGAPTGHVRFCGQLISRKSLLKSIEPIMDKAGTREVTLFCCFPLGIDAEDGEYKLTAGLTHSGELMITRLVGEEENYIQIAYEE